MKNEDYPYSRRLRLAGEEMVFRLHFPNAAAYFAPYEVKDGAKEVPVLAVTEDDWAYLTALGFKRDGENEAGILTALSSDVLLPKGKCPIHAVAVNFRGKAWLICAESGVGKSTQARNLTDLRPGEAGVICGDRPVLELKEDGHVFVHPSPWNGKEDWKGAPGAPLAGLVLLKRGEENALREVHRREAAVPVYKTLIQTGQAEETVRAAAAFADGLLKGVPVWELTSFQVPDSTKLLLEAIEEEEKEGTTPTVEVKEDGHVL